MIQIRHPVKEIIEDLLIIVKGIYGDFIMIGSLAKIANKLDSLSLTKEADVINLFMIKVADDAHLGGDETAPLSSSQYNEAVGVVNKLISENEEEGLLGKEGFLQLLNYKLAGTSNSHGGFVSLKIGDRALYNLYNYYIKGYKWVKDGGSL